MTTMPLFDLPADGWYQISAKGEFPHKPTGLLQVIDDDACRRMLERFRGESGQPNFAGLLVDFDHFSLDQDKPSEAAGWIVGLEPRENGLWAQIRWTDRGAESVRGGRYRFISPVWRQDDCEKMENNRVRPTRLLNCALTNDPNITGMVPLSNSVRTKAAPSPRVNVPNVYLFNRAIANAQPMTDEQRRAMFARMGRGGGASSAPRSEPSGRTYEGDGQWSEPPASSPLDGTGRVFASGRDSAARIEELNRQKAELESQRQPRPQKADYSQIDTRDLQRKLMAEGKGVNDIRAALKAAEAENLRRRSALREVRRKINDQYPNDPERQRAELAQYFDREERYFQEAVANWEKFDRRITDKVAKLDAAIQGEVITANETTNTLTIREHNAKVEEEQKARAALDKAIQQRVKADLEEARRQAAAQEKARKEAEKAAAVVKTDPASDYRKELNRRRLYWQAATRGDWAQATAIYPEARHDQNRQTLLALTPPSKSKANQKVFEDTLRRLQYEAP